MWVMSRAESVSFELLFTSFLMGRILEHRERAGGTQDCSSECGFDNRTIKAVLGDKPQNFQLFRIIHWRLHPENYNILASQLPERTRPENNLKTSLIYDKEWKGSRPPSLIHSYVDHITGEEWPTGCVIWSTRSYIALRLINTIMPYLVEGNQ